MSAWVCLLAALIREALLKSGEDLRPFYWIFYGRGLTVCDPYHTGEKHTVQNGRRRFHSLWTAETNLFRLPECAITAVGKLRQAGVFDAYATRMEFLRTTGFVQQPDCPSQPTREQRVRDPRTQATMALAPLSATQPVPCDGGHSEVCSARIRFHPSDGEPEAAATRWIHERRLSRAAVVLGHAGAFQHQHYRACVRGLGIAGISFLPRC